jgi:hypothetical protein
MADDDKAKPLPPGVTMNPDGTIYHYGNTVRMDRMTMPKNNGQFAWVVYALVPTQAGEHPTDGIGGTTEPAVWVQQGMGEEADAAALCSQLSGIKATAVEE